MALLLDGLTPEELKKIKSKLVGDSSEVASEEESPSSHTPVEPEQTVASEEESPSSHTPVEAGRKPASGPAPAMTNPIPIEKQSTEGLTNLAPGPGITDQFKAAQDRAENITLMNQLAKSANQIAYGIPVVTGGPSGMIKPTQVNNEVLDTNIALAQKIPDQIKAQLEMDHQDPNSDISRSSQAVLAKAFPQFAAQVKNMSAAQLKEAFPMIAKHIDHQDSIKARMQQAAQHQEEMRQRRDEQNLYKYTTLGAREVKSIETHPLVVQADKRLMALDKAKETIMTGGVLTPQLLSDAEQDILSAMTGSTTPATGKLSRTEFKSLQLYADKLQQFMSGKPIDIRKSSPEVIKYVSGMVDLMKKAYTADRQSKVNQLVEEKSRLYKDNKAASPILESLQAMKTPIEQEQPAVEEERRVLKDGRTAIFDRQSKKFLRFE